MRPACLVSILLLESIGNLNVERVIQSSVCLRSLQESKLLRDLEHMSVNGNCLWAVHREESDAVCNLPTDSLELHQL
jgi:hypothetical protein